MKLRESLVKNRSSVFDASMEGVKRELESMWSRYVIEPKLNVALTSSYQVRKHIQMITGRDGKADAFPLPYLAVVPGPVEISTEGYNAFVMSRIGVRVGLINDGAQEIREKLVPIDYGLGVRFVTRSSDEATAFTMAWQRQQLSRRFDLVHPDTGTRISIKMLFDKQLVTPEADFGGDPGDLIIIDTSMIVKTYVGDTEMNTTIKHVDFSLRQPTADGFSIELSSRRIDVIEEPSDA